MALHLCPAIASNYHSDHVSGDAVFVGDNSVRSALISANGANFVGVEFVPASVALVFHLLFSSDPVAVFRRVIAVIVTTIQRKFRIRSFAHIGKKVFEFVPSFTDANSAASVILERDMTRVIATAKHAVPDKIFGALRGSGHPFTILGNGS